MRFSDHRRQYTLGGLRRADLAEDPVAQFVVWMDLFFTPTIRVAKRRRSLSGIKPRCCSPGMNSTGRYR